MKQLATFQYASRVDGVQPLAADVCYLADGRPKPVVLVMHGYSGKRQDVRQDIEDLATRGVVAIAPDMRGRGDSAGEWDSGGLDVHDAVDAALSCIETMPGEVNAANINIVGYSGGGGNAIAAACRFPDLFNTAVSFFGIADYGRWRSSLGRPDCNARMDAAIGSPEQHPGRYEARNMVPAAGNAKKTNWWLFWDEQEKQCPAKACVEPWIDAARAAGVASLKVRMSRITDEKRWFHGYRTNHPQLASADDLFLPDIFAGPRDLSLPDAGELSVPGHLVTRRFSVFVGDGTEGRVRVRYRIDNGAVDVQVVSNPRNLPVTVRHDSVTAALPR